MSAPEESMKDENPDDQHTGIFAEDQINALDVFGKACEDEGLNTAIAIVEHPITRKPIIFIRGHIYYIGLLTTRVANDIKNQLLKELQVR